MKQVELAAETNLSLGTIRNYEGGKTDPSSVKHLQRIARVTGVDLLWLIEGEREGAAA